MIRAVRQKYELWGRHKRAELLRLLVGIAAIAAVVVGHPRTLVGQGAHEHGDSVSVHLDDVDLRVAVQALGRYLDRPVLFGSVTAGKVTLETPRPVSRADVPRLLRGVVESQNLELVNDSSAGVYRVRAREVPHEAASPTVNVQQQRSNAQQLFVIHLHHAQAADVAASVNALYGRAAALGELGSSRQESGAGGTLNEALRANMLPPQLPTQASGAVAGVAGRVASLSGDITIVPDTRTNSLLIRATQNDYELIQAAVSQLDVRPLQVLIEVIIAEVRRDRSFSFGLDLSVPDSHIPGIKGAHGTMRQGGLGTGDFALHVMRNGPGLDIDATLQAAAARGDAKILSRPIVIAANNETADILVGTQRPFVQVSRSLPTETPTRDQVVEYKDVGTHLKVRPTISGDGYVALAVTQEVNNATTETQFDAPVISTRTVATSLLVRDSQTVVLGGLTDKEGETTQSGVPILSTIPLIGGFFGHATHTTTETEFFLFITPRVIRTDEEAEHYTKPYAAQSDLTKQAAK